MMYGLGRVPAEDTRDRMFLASDAIPETTLRPWRYWWPEGWWGDQGATPQCVGYSCAHIIEDGPLTHAPTRARGVGPVLDPTLIYTIAQREYDEWPGEAYAGTSIRAGVKVLQRYGLVGTYRWAWDLDTCIQTVITEQPVLVGSWWYEDMFYPDKSGYIRIGGRRAGGHAYVINGANKIRRIARIKNSWGRGWGRRGHAYISFADLARLIHEAGEVCVPTEIRRPDRLDGNGHEPDGSRLWTLTR